jgi:hypothetical protein
MSETLRDLRSLPLEELIRRHDNRAQHTEVAVSFYLEEIARRDTAQQVTAMVRLTKWIAAMTAIITASTIANIILEILRGL